MGSTPYSVAREHLLTAVRSNAVADAAGVDRSLWSSTDSPRVIARDVGGLSGGLHRGRLPMVEIFQSMDNWSRPVRNGGMINATWTVRVHVPQIDGERGEVLARGILCNALAVIRADDYCNEGSESFGPLVNGPMHNYMELKLTLVHVYDRSTYEVS